jgi:UDP-glucose 4-epimerase
VGLGLLDTMHACDVRQIVFSSSASVYGEPEKQPVEEGDATRPTSPYGETKLAFERALHWYDHAYRIRSVSLRYFNAAGASERCGEDHRPETHLIPRILRVALGREPALRVFGEDYPTRDGTCIRDYIHVLDLADAHVAALRHLGGSPGRSSAFNLGCGGEGYTVREVLAAAREVTGRPIPLEIGPRRPGDPAVLVASSARIRAELGWAPRHQQLLEIIGSAWAWMRKHPAGWAA